MRNYHYDEDYRIVKQCDDLVSALRYAIMMRRSGKPLSECEGIGYGNMPYAHQQPQRGRSRSRFARGTDNHPDGGFNPFTGR